MTIPFQCACGTLQGKITPRHAYVRATCYCRDCRASARTLGRAEVLDAHGGADIIAMLPAGLRITAGGAQLACLSLSPRGLLRWYAACCNTPIANTPRERSLPYVGVLAHCVAAAPDEVDAAFGPSRIALHTASAEGQVAATPVRTTLGVLRIMAGVAAARLRGRGADNPFFEAGSSRPVAEPRVLTLQERAAASAPPA
ncbi:MULTISPECIES: DUF6151 family protein [unclassified Luteimonas]|uniref:DUF6151 family protein n=1 Tax=unclassified Luteimonas TaxID=2629088 RepID=UPI001602DD1D|nr:MULTISPECIES: DUF6151 family protein [unclassified Luteimonas]MBB1471696.1 hypothetical protein [Luteimonas sp. MC1782]MBB6599563.1 hypothetical protein [Luteimonas sp. MC1825]QOC87256.1 hypothetical protein IDM46_08170 [Luteimonas sp. MC1825]